MRKFDDAQSVRLNINDYKKMNMSKPETYRESLEICRNKNKKDFWKIPCVPALFSLMDSFMSLLVTSLKDAEFEGSDDEQRYKLKLIVSFIRTHYVIDDLICNGENIEAVTLIRKQLELLNRYKELETKSKEELEGKVPNVKFVANLASLYGSLSEIAHSSKELPLSLLGMEKVEEGRIGVNVFPVYTENLITTMSNHITLFCCFAAEMLNFQCEFIKDWDGSEDKDILSELIEVGKQSCIPCFEQW